MDVVRTERSRSERAAAGENHSEAFFREHAVAVHAYAVRRVGSTAGEDITAEVFLEAVRHWRRKANADPLPWLYGIARRKVADHLRKRSRQPATQLSDTMPGNMDVHGFVEAGERSKELRRLVDALPIDQREALLLFYVEDLSAEQIARSMSKSVAAVNSLLQRARQKLRESGAGLKEVER